MRRADSRLALSRRVGGDQRRPAAEQRGRLAAGLGVSNASRHTAVGGPPAPDAAAARGPAPLWLRGAPTPGAPCHPFPGYSVCECARDSRAQATCNWAVRAGARQADQSELEWLVAGQWNRNEHSPTLAGQATCGRSMERAFHSLRHSGDHPAFLQSIRQSQHRIGALPAPAQPQPASLKRAQPPVAAAAPGTPLVQHHAAGLTCSCAARPVSCCRRCRAAATFASRRQPGRRSCSQASSSPRRHRHPLPASQQLFCISSQQP